MTTAAIGIFAPGTSEQAKQVHRRLVEDGVNAVLFDTDIPSTERVSLDEEGARWNGYRLEELETAYIHGYDHESPIVPAPGGMRDWSVWQADYPARQQRQSFLTSLFIRLAHHGVRLVNPVEAAQVMFAKAHLLASLAAEGFLMPDMIVSNDSETAKAFCTEHETVVWRPQNGRAAWQLCQEKQRKDIVQAGKPPVILARGISGLYVRAWVFEGEPLLALQASPPSDSVPERLEQMTRIDLAPYVECLGRLAETLDIPWFQVAFVPVDDQPCIYDIDADPVIDWLPSAFGEHLTNSLAACLSGSKLVGAVKVDSQKRPALFLRRMLRVLFEFEQCKYGDAKSK
ncbi:hypothetical protein [uncultured Pseudodesulfovibrio sp.]|uniref:hypothetical protein n=1 Tax=uncultured Pseudodesulfovibrio sp. TaxID=2035858 RepID=UPI0029C6CCA0|nr:hypothetical protein [uncultured Pseudodesulfovibrio sp.]